MRCTLATWVCVLVAVSAAAQKTGNTDSTVFIRWAMQHALPLQHSDSAIGDADLLPVKDMIGNARVVALGEPAHGFHEPQVFRNRLFRFLVERCGFTTIALEADFARSLQAASFVAGGPGTAAEAAAKLSIAGPSPENIALLEWMRQYNAKAATDRRLSFYGMDMQLVGFPGDTTPSHAAIDEVLQYLEKVDAAEAARLRAGVQPVLPRLSVANYPELTTQDKKTLTTTLSAIDSLLKTNRLRYINRSTESGYERACRNLSAAQQTHRMVQATPPEQPGVIPAEAWRAVNVRDSSMADNVLWMLHRQANTGKVLVYAHNAHVKNEVTRGSVWDAFSHPPNSMGMYLRSLLGKDLFIMGSSCSPFITTAPPGSLDAALQQADKPRFMLHLHLAAGNAAVTSWLSAKRPMAANTVHYLLMEVGKAFDALLFIRQ